MSDNGRDIPLGEPDEMLEEEITYTVLDDERREELNALVDLKVLGIELEVWDEEEEDSGEEEPTLFDCDLFMDEGQALELYAAVAYADPEKEPAKGVDPIFEVVGKLVDDELALLDFQQADEEGGLLLAFGKDEEVRLVVLANEWMVSEWEGDFEEEGDGDDEA